MDELVEQNLKRLALQSVSLIPLRDAEDARLLAIKPTRNRGEYCWTLTPFTPQFVFDRNTHVYRVTYLDADLYFFASPKILLDEFERSGKHVLITEHAYAPEYDRAAKSGRFCVQFMTFCRSQEGLRVLKWWQDKCIEWCFDRYENGKFGDQKYLDQWPTLFSNEVHILEQVDKTLAPWNVDYFLSNSISPLIPVFFHFQSFRLIDVDTARLYVGVRLKKQALKLYESYLICIGKQLKVLNGSNISISNMPTLIRKFQFLRNMYMRLFKKVFYVDLRDYIK